VVKRFWREPLVHFVLLGAALFAAFDVAGKRPQGVPAKIVVTQGQIAAMNAEFARTWQRPPTPQELDGLIGDRIREEVYCREAVALGLDKDDAVIRRRLRQKLEFVSEDAASALEPTDDDLRGYFRAHPDSFRGADGGVAEFADVRDAVLREWTSAKRIEADDAYYQGMLRKYTVVVQR
jgi:hypothetical protein